MPARHTATIACTSFSVPLSVRMFALITRMTSSLSAPRSYRRTERKRRPSWRKSVEPTCIELGTGPPTSLQCAFTDTNPVSCPSQNTGAVIATSLTWLPLPAYGSLWMNTSPSRKASMPRSRIVASIGKPRWPWNTGSPTPWAIIRTSASKIAQPKSRLSLMMWLYAVLIIVIRMRSAAALSAARITSTVMGSARTSVVAMLIARLLSSPEPDHQASVLLDGQDVARLHERGRPGLLDGRRALDDVSRAQVAALDDTVCDEGSARWRVDPSRLENRRLPGVAELRQPASLDGHHESQPKIDQLHRDVGRGVAIHAFMRGVELAAKLIPHPRIRQLHRH